MAVPATGGGAPDPPAKQPEADLGEFLLPAAIGQPRGPTRTDRSVTKAFVGRWITIPRTERPLTG